MSAGKTIGYIVAAILIFFGVLFIWGAFSPQGEPGWIVVGIITAAIGLGIIAFIRFREPKPAQPPQEIIQKIDLSGEVELEKLKCQNCGAELDQDSIKVKEGAIFVSCPYCGTAYQMVEEPKW
jgi:predicted RNA-binding Zn-ribbon protein involved in translation (DUF1610 family)